MRLTNEIFDCLDCALIHAKETYKKAKQSVVQVLTHWDHPKANGLMDRIHNRERVIGIYGGVPPQLSEKEAVRIINRWLRQQRKTNRSPSTSTL